VLGRWHSFLFLTGYYLRFCKKEVLPPLIGNEEKIGEALKMACSTYQLAKT
jgi:hypothetical protein